MKLFRWVEKYVWVVFIGSIGVGLASDFPGSLFRSHLRYLLMGVLFFTCLKADFYRILHYSFKPYFVLYLTLLKLFIIPFILYYISLMLLPKYAIGVFILYAMPSAMVCGTLSDVAGGSVEAAFSGTIYTTLVSTLTIPLLANIFLKGEMEISMVFEKIKFLLLTIIIPLVAAFAIKNLFLTTIKRFNSIWTPLSIMSASIITMTAISANRNFIFGNWESLISLLPLIIIFFGLVLFISYYFLTFPFTKDQRVAFSINIAFVNNGLAIVFIMEFFMNQFGSEIIFPSILVEVPMAFMILPLRYLTSSFSKNHFMRDFI